MRRKTQITQRDVAREAGVSQYTVSVALRGDHEIPRETRDRVLRAAVKLGYKRDPLISAAMARLNARGEAEYLGAIAVVWQFGNPELTPIGCLEAIRQRCHEAGYHVEMFRVDPESSNSARAITRIIRARGVDAVIAWEVMNRVETDKPLEELLEDIPVVYLGRTVPFSHPAWYVAPDRSHAGYQAVVYALERGYRRPGFISRLEAGWNTRSTFLGGYLQAVQTLLPKENQIPPILGEKVASLELCGQWFEEFRPDVVIGALDRAEQAIAQVRQDLGVEIPYIRLELEGPRGAATCVAADWAAVGSAATNFAFAAIQHHFTGRPALPTRLLVESVWHEGNSLPDRRSTLSDDKRRGQKPLSLQKHFTHETGRTGGWLGSEPLLGLREGEFITDEVRFQLTRFPAGKTPGSVIFQSRNYPEEPAELLLPITGKLRGISFLHACGFAGKFERLAQYELIYADGSSSLMPVISLGGAVRLPRLTTPGEPAEGPANIQDWWPTYPPLPGHVIITAREDPSYIRQLYHLHWENPSPAKAVRKLRVRSEQGAGSTLAILAITICR